MTDIYTLCKMIDKDAVFDFEETESKIGSTKINKKPFFEGSLL